MQWHIPGRLPVGLLFGMLLAACGAPPERGYFRPAGREYADLLVSYKEESSDAIIVAACQGAYVDRVRGAQVMTVHIQFDVTRPRGGDLILRRDAVQVDVQPTLDAASVELSLAEAFSGTQPITGDLVIPAWSLRPFDLFFDAEELLASGPPVEVLLRWKGTAAGVPVEGQCSFVQIPLGDPRRPSDTPMADMSFGMRGGYYLPGRLRMGDRRLQPSGEERLHYVFHAPETW